MINQINVITTSIAGTGGGRLIALILNTLASRGIWPRVYLQLLPDKGMASLLRVGYQSIDDFVDDGEPVICFDTGVGGRVGEIFLNCRGQKIFYLVLLHEEYEKVLTCPDVVKVGYSSFLCRAANGVGYFPGPTDVYNFFPDSDLPRSNYVLYYMKKAGWVGVSAVEMICQAKPGMIPATLGMDGMNERVLAEGHIIRPKMPIMDVGAPAHKKEALRLAYQRAQMYVAADSNGGWGNSLCLSEAMLCKCPVVSTDTPCFAEFVIPEVTARAVPRDAAPELPHGTWMTRPAPEHLKARALEVWDNPEETKKMVEAAYTHVRRFDVWAWSKWFGGILGSL